MATQKFEDSYEFPDEKTEKASAEEKFEIEIEDDTPAQDRGRKPMKEPVEDPTEDELSTYDEKVQARIKKFTRGYHDERRAKEEALREREAAENFAKQVYEENKKLQQQLSNGSKVYIEQSQSTAQLELDSAKKDQLNRQMESEGVRMGIDAAKHKAQMAMQQAQRAAQRNQPSNKKG